jgi:hypothetical protein
MAFVPAGRGVAFPHASKLQGKKSCVAPTAPARLEKD